ncbi:unnamed protein product [Closterium sp. Yama58-4]|nr:unnamed protein product [Closterium sp. Yama58-4]
MRLRSGTRDFLFRLNHTTQVLDPGVWFASKSPSYGSRHRIPPSGTASSGVQVIRPFSNTGTRDFRDQNSFTPMEVCDYIEFGLPGSVLYREFLLSGPPASAITAPSVGTASTKPSIVQSGRDLEDTTILHPISTWNDIPIRPADSALSHGGGGGCALEEAGLAGLMMGDSIAMTCSCRQDDNIGGDPQSGLGDICKSCDKACDNTGKNAGCDAATCSTTCDKHAPLEVIEIGRGEARVGQVYAVKPLLAFLVFSPDMKSSWKIVAVNSSDPMAAALLDSRNGYPIWLEAKLREIVEWLKYYKCNTVCKWNLHSEQTASAALTNAISEFARVPFAQPASATAAAADGASVAEPVGQQARKERRFRRSGSEPGWYSMRKKELAIKIDERADDASESDGGSGGWERGDEGWQEYDDAEQQQKQQAQQQGNPQQEGRRMTRHWRSSSCCALEIPTGMLLDSPSPLHRSSSSHLRQPLTPSPLTRSASTFLRQTLTPFPLPRPPMHPLTPRRHLRAFSLSSSSSQKQAGSESVFCDLLESDQVVGEEECRAVDQASKDSPAAVQRGCHGRSRSSISFSISETNTDTGACVSGNRNAVRSSSSSSSSMSSSSHRMARSSTLHVLIPPPLLDASPSTPPPTIPSASPNSIYPPLKPPPGMASPSLSTLPSPMPAEKVGRYDFRRSMSAHTVRDSQTPPGRVGKLERSGKSGGLDADLLPDTPRERAGVPKSPQAGTDLSRNSKGRSGLPKTPRTPNTPKTPKTPKTPSTFNVPKTPRMPRTAGEDSSLHKSPRARNDLPKTPTAGNEVPKTVLRARTDLGLITARAHNQLGVMAPMEQTKLPQPPEAASGAAGGSGGNGGDAGAGGGDAAGDVSAVSQRDGSSASLKQTAGGGGEKGSSKSRMLKAVWEEREKRPE